MTPADYDAWYDTPRGRWIADAERCPRSRLLWGGFLVATADKRQ